MFISLVDTKSKTHISVQVDVSCGSFAALKHPFIVYDIILCRTYIYF